ncbi:MAG: SDR family oxidoreductase [Microthrixaceae bacterium]
MGMLEGKQAVVTGVGPGLGREVALALAREGADVALVARSERVTPQVAAEIEAMGRRAPVLCANIADSADVARLAQEVGEAFDGRVDVLVNSAFRSGDFSSFADGDLAKWRKVTEVNLWGGLEVTQAMLGLLDGAVADSGDARVIMVNTMSIQHIQAGSGSYVASKAGLAGVTQVLATELGARGIRVNSVHPGYIFGDSVRIYFEMQAEERGEGVTWEDVYAEVAAETALGYLAHPSEIAGTVVYLASPLAKPVTGAAIPVNCGHWIPGLT